MRKKIAIIRLISLFSGIYFWLFAGISAYANPQGPLVVHGQAGFSNPNPNTLHVTNSPNAIINWQGFSIQSHEVTRFIQQSPNSAVLNRVIGQDPSHLLGQLLSNGKVFLINPHGMVFGPNCVIDTAGFVASTLNITDQDFLQGNLKFEGGPDSGSIVNQGFITAGKNGDIYLIAPNIENSGIIHTEGGNLLLAAGESITITSLDLKDVHFEIQAPENEVLNIGKVLADGGAVNVFAGTLRHSGEIRADTVAVDETGTIILTASKDIILESGSIVSASGAPGGVHDGGDVRIIAEDTLNMKAGAEVHVDGGPDGGDGGFLELSGKQQIALNGIYTGKARAEGFRNGSLLLDPTNIIIINGGVDDTGGDGVILAGDPGGTLNINPTSLLGAWTDVSLAATSDITVSSPIVDGNIPPGGSFTLDAGNDVIINAQIGTVGARFDHDMMLTAGNNIDINSPIYLNNNLLSAKATNISFDALVDVGSGTVRLEATGGVTQSAPLTAGLAELLGSGAYTLNDPGNRIDEVRMDTGSVILTNNGTIQVNGFLVPGPGQESVLAAPTPVASEYLGASIDVDGDVMVVGAPGAHMSAQGAAYVYRWNGTTWVFEARLTAGGTINFGNSVAVEGTRIVVGAPESNSSYSRGGEVYSFEWNGTDWGTGTQLSCTDRSSSSLFGLSMSIDNDRLAVGGAGSSWAGRIWYFELVGGVWTQKDTKANPSPSFDDYFGHYIDMSNEWIIVGTSIRNGNPGEAYIFEINPGTGLLTQKQLLSLGGPGDFFGDNVSISGDLAAVSKSQANGSAGSVYVYRYNGTSWVEEQIIAPADVAAGDRFGYAVRVHDGVIIATSAHADLPGYVDAGAGYVFKYDGTWLQDSKITATTPAASDWFGTSATQADQRIFFGALYADPGGTGNAGAAYAYEPVNTGSTLTGGLTITSLATGDVEVVGPVQAGGSVNLTAGGDLFIHASLESVAGNMQFTGPQEIKVFNNYAMSGQHVSINAAGNLDVDGLTTGVFIVEGGSVAPDTDTIINAVDITLINLGSGSPSVQVIGGSTTNSEVHLQATGSMSITASDGVLVSGGAADSWAQLSAGAGGQTISAKYVEVVSCDSIIAPDLSGISTNAGGVQNITTTGENNDNGISVIASGTGGVAIHSDGTQAINVSNADYMKVIGTVGNADISSNGAQTITVTGTGGAANNELVVGSATAQGSSAIYLLGGNQNITVDALSLYAGAADGSNADVNSIADQDLNISGLIKVKGGSSPNGAWAAIHANADQTVVANGIEVEGGMGGAENGAYITAGNSQSITAGSGGILVEGGDSGNIGHVGPGNWAEIALDSGATGTQTIQINDGGNLVITSGNGAEDDWANICGYSTGNTSVTLNGGGSLYITGGSSDRNDHVPNAVIHSISDLTVDVSGGLFMYGGAGLDTEACISSNSDLQVTVTGGNVTLMGGSGTEATAYIQGDALTVLDITSGDLLLSGGSGSDAGAVIGGPDIDVDAGGSVILIGGSGVGAVAAIGLDDASTVIDIGNMAHIAGNVVLLGGTGTGAEAMIGAVGPGNNADVTFNIDGSLLVNGLNAGAIIGSMDAGGTVVIYTGLSGTGDLILGWGEIRTTGDVTLNVADMLVLYGGAAANQASRVISDTLTVNAGSLEQIAGSGNYADTLLDANSGMTLNITGDALLQAGNGDYAQTEISSRTGTQDINIGGSFTILGGGGIDANASTNAEGGGNLEMDVAGDLILSGGSALDASAAVTTVGGGTIDLSVGGGLIMTGGSGQDASAGIGSGGIGTPIFNIDVAGDLQMSGGAGQWSAAIIGSDDQSVVINIGHFSPIGGNISISGGTGVDAIALIGTIGAGHDADVTIKADGAFTMNAQTGGALVGSTDFAGGAIDIDASDITLDNGTLSINNHISLNASGGMVAQGAAGVINNGPGTANQLNVTSDCGIDLPGLNTVGLFAPGTTTGGVLFNQVGNLVINGLNAGGGDATLSATGSVTQTAAINNTDYLTVTSGSGITLTDGANSVSHFNATDTGGVGISYQNNGNLGLGLVDAGTGNFSLTVTSDIIDDNGGTMNIIANLADLNALGGSVGTLADLLETQLNTLVVTDADVEVGIDNNGPLTVSGATFPAAVTADILLKASTIDFSGPLSKPGSIDLRGANGITVNWDLTSTGGDLKLAAGSGTLLIDGVTVTANQDMTLSGSSVRIEGSGNNDALATAGGDQTVNAGSLLVKGSDTGTGEAKLAASGTQTINAGSVTVQGGDNANAPASIDPSGLVMNVSGDVNVLGGDGDGSYAEISAETVEITAGPTLDAGNINITGGSGDNAGAWIKSIGGDVTLIAGDTIFPADINLIGGAGTDADSLINAGGGAFDVYLTFHNGVGLTLLPGLTGATDVGILAMCLILNSYNPFYQPPVDPIGDVVSSQDQLDTLLDEIMGAPDDLVVTGGGTGDDEEEDEKKRGRLICR